MIPQPVIIGAVAWLVVINLATFAAFAWDKRQSIKGRRRFTEIGLIQMGALGGGLAMALLRHKSSKPPFQRRFWGAFFSQLLIVACVLILWIVLRAD